MAGQRRNDGPEKLGPFTLDGVIGAGGFGTVYRAHDEGGRTVALKVLASHGDSADTLRRFEREGSIRIDHPNVVTVLDAGEDRGVPYIAFELLEGGPLTQRLEDAPLAPSEVIEIALQVCAGLDAAHGLGIVHRDLKPGNVFRLHDGRIKILDFGIARPMSEAGPQLTMVGSVIGTPGYLAPEQAKGEAKISPAADLWSLGVILYQALTGRNPFMRASAVATILAVVLEEPPPLGDHGEALPRGLAEIVQRCLHKEPSERWPTAESLAIALRSIDPTGSLVVGIPPELGASIPQDERRVVALLLATDVHDLAALDAAVREWGGELIPMLGAQAIGVFGGHTYEGDESLRAVRAALAARDAAGHMAVASGRASGAGGTVSGDAVRAVEQVAEAKLDGVAVDAGAARGLAGVLELRRHGPLLYEVPRSSPRFDTGNFPALARDLPLLGRDTELTRLDVAIAGAFEHRKPQIVWVSGPPGIGKSRLRAELERRVRAQDVLVLGGRAESHRREAAFHLIASALRSDPLLEPFFMNPDVPDERKRRALEEFLVDALDDATWARHCLDPIARVLGLPEPGVPATTHRRTDPQLMADRVRVSLADVLGALIAKGPLALVLDDVQWADAASLQLAAELAGRSANRPFVLFLAARSELDERAGELFVGRDIVRIAPRGLDAEEVHALAKTIALRDVPEKLTQDIAARTGGNPFFVEQIVRELVEQELLDGEVGTLPIPLDVEAAVQSRLDHLPIAEKQLCKRAAVYDGAFDEPALRALDVVRAPRAMWEEDTRELSGKALRAGGVEATLLGSLTKRGLVSMRVRGEGGTEREYRFKNSLVAEVAYRMNGDEARRELHRAAARFLAGASDADREEIGRHYELGEDVERAAEAYAEAALRAARRGDSVSVLRCSERALMLSAGGPVLFDLLLARADAFSFLGQRDEQRKAIEGALSAADDDVRRARALSEKAGMLASLGEHEDGLAVADRAVLAAREAGDEDVLALALARRGWLLLYLGRVSDAAEAIGGAGAAMGRLAPETAAFVAAWRAQLFTALGDLGKRRLAYEDAVARFRAIGDLRRLASAECNLADTLNRVGAYEDAEAALRDALALCRRVGNRVVEGYALVNLGYALAGQGKGEEALRTFDEALEHARNIGRGRLELAVRLYRARALLDAGRAAEVIELARVVAAEAADGGSPALSANALAVASRAALALGDAATAVSYADRAMELRDEIGTIEEDEAEIFLALADALTALGETERAKEILARGASRLEFLAGRIEDASWRARFLVEVPMNRRLIELDGER